MRVYVHHHRCFCVRLCVCVLLCDCLDMPIDWSELWQWVPSVHLQSNLIDLKEHASSLASSGLKKDSKLKSLEIAIEQKKEECSKLETQLQKVGLSLPSEQVTCNDPTLCRMYEVLKAIIRFRFFQFQKSFIAWCSGAYDCIRWACNH